jgi:hypothetical protein
MTTIMRSKRAMVAMLACLSLLASAEDSVQQRKNQTIAKADKLFGRRYTPMAGEPLRLYDQQNETGPPDSVVYWHGASYVISVIFAADGTIAMLTMLPEALLHSNSRSDAEDAVELLPAEMALFISNANELQSLGKAQEVHQAPDSCFESGRNLYCTDTYAAAVLSHYHTENFAKKRLGKIALKEVAIFYRQIVVGVVEDVRVVGSQRNLKVGGQWYHGEKPGEPVFDETQIGSTVRLITHGCSVNEKACIAGPIESSSFHTAK